jgi:hypothetical protein
MTVTRDRVLPTLTHRVEVPLFSRYVFVNIRTDQRWGPVRSTPGVHQLLLTGEVRPQRVGADVIEALRAGEAARAQRAGGGVRGRLGRRAALPRAPFAGTRRSWWRSRVLAPASRCFCLAGCAKCWCRWGVSWRRTATTDNAAACRRHARIYGVVVARRNFRWRPLVAVGVRIYCVYTVACWDRKIFWVVGVATTL